MQEALLSDADAKKTVVFFMKFPNKRISEVELVLAGWSLQAVDTPKGKVLQVEVYGKQNSVKWSVEQPAGGGQ